MVAICRCKILFQKTKFYFVFGNGVQKIMPYEDSWYVEKRVAIQRLYGVITVEESEMARDGVIRLLEEGTPLVHILVDVSDVEKFPTNITAIRRMIPNVDSPNMGWLLIYGA